MFTLRNSPSTQCLPCSLIENESSLLPPTPKAMAGGDYTGVDGGNERKIWKGCISECECFCLTRVLVLDYREGTEMAGGLKFMRGG